MISLAFIKGAINSAMMWVAKACSHMSAAIVGSSPREELVWPQPARCGV